MIERMKAKGHRGARWLEGEFPDKSVKMNIDAEADQEMLCLSIFFDIKMEHLLIFDVMHLCKFYNHYSANEEMCYNNIIILNVAFSADSV